MSPLRDLLQDGQPHLMDGAMGTMLYDHGIFLNVCYDALNHTRPELVTSIHRAYVEAGSEIIETNTFGANPVKLSAFGLDDQTEAINAAGVRCARQAIEQCLEAGRITISPCVVGAIGPLGLRVEPWGPTSFSEARGYFSRQVRGLLDGGVDGFLLETFQDLGELEEAVLAVRDASDLPVLVQVTLAEGGRTALGTPVAQVVDVLAALNVDAFGFNCSTGPAEILEAIEEAAERTTVPLMAQPNAGLPRSVGDRTIYLASPEYMARYAHRMLDLGARFLGGCCGTTPDHIRELKRMLDGTRSGTTARIQAEARQTVPDDQDRGDRGTEKKEASTPPTPTLSALLGAPGWVRCAECGPHSGWRTERLLAEVADLKTAGAQVVALPDAPRGVAQIPSTMVAALIQSNLDLLALPHYTARDRILMDMVSDLMGLAGMGVHQVLLKSDDPSTIGPYPDPSRYSEVDAIGLTHAVAHLRTGSGLSGGSRPEPCPLLPGVRLNQVSPDPTRAYARYRYKVEAGASFALTQPVYDPEPLWRFIEANPNHKVPLLAVLRPLTSADEADFLANEVPGHLIPPSLRSRLAQAEAQGGANGAREEGLAIALETLEALRDSDLKTHIGGIYIVGTVQGPRPIVAKILEILQEEEMRHVPTP